MLYSFLQILIAIGMKTSIWRFLIINLILLQVAALSGQTKGRNPGYLEYENYTVADGFPDIQAQKIIQDRKGFLWIAAGEGLVRFDGYNFKRYQPDKTIVGRSNKIQDLYLDNEGNILCLADGVLREFAPKSEKFTTIEYAFAGENFRPLIYAIEQDDFGNIWLGTQGKGLRIIRRPLNGKKNTILTIPSLTQAGKRDSILTILDLLDPKQYIQISQVGNNADEEQIFQVNTSQNFVLIYFGEYGPEGAWLDVGWLENEQGDTIWRPVFDESIVGARSYFARMQMDTIHLLPGSYSLKFHTNNNFSFNYLKRTREPYAKRWGITAIPIDQNENKIKLLKQVLSYKQVLKSSRWLSNSFVRSLYKHDNGDIYVGTLHGMEVFSQEGSGPIIEDLPYPYVKHIQFARREDGLLSSTQVLKIEGGTNEQIWIAGFNPRLQEGAGFTLDLYNPTSERYRSISHSVSLQPKVINRVGMYYLNDMLPDGQGGLWLSASHSGLYHLPTTHIKNENTAPVEIDSFSYPFDHDVLGPHILDLMTDQNNNIWISTNHYMIYKLGARSGKMNYLEIPTIEDQIRSLFADSQSRIWITTRKGSFLLCYDTKKKNFIPLPPDQGENLIAKMEDNEGNIWFGGSEGRIAKYNPSKHKFQYYRIADSGVIQPYFQNSEGLIWIADIRSNISLFDPKKQIFHAIPTHSDTSNLGLWQGITFMQQIDSVTWIGYGAGGLGKIRPKQINGRDTLLFSEYLANYVLYSFTKDFKGRLWVGTFGKGLLLFDEEKGITKRFSTKNGLFDNYIAELYPDNQQRLWIHTRKGLQALDLTTDTFTNIRFIEKFTEGAWFSGTVSDLDDRFYVPQSNHFYYISQSGHFYVSQKKGIYYFDLDSIAIDTLAPSMVLTDFLIDNQSVEPGDNSSLSSTITYAESIRLSYQQNNIALSYAGIHYDNPKEHRYAYRLLGLNDQWQEVGTERTARFNKLAPGQYTFEVKAANMDGVWTNKPARLGIIIMAPWFWNGWSKLLYLLVGMGLLFYTYQFQLNRQLAEAEARRLAELDTVKTKLYTNITHEFRTPLTVISGMAEEVLENPQKWFREGLEMIKRNSNHLLQLVNQLLDLSKLESGSLQVTMVQDDIIFYLKYLVESFQSFAHSKEIQLSIISKVKDLNMDFDPTKAQSICSNLLSNAIKFTPNGGVIQVEINEVPSPQGQSYCQIRISDNGPGIPEAALPYIFDRFYQADNTTTRQAEGTGVGLALTKELVEILKGKIEVESKTNIGTTFRIKLPIHKQAQPSDARALLAPISQHGSLPRLVLDSPSLVPPAQQPSVLLVEDNADVLQYLTSCLADQYQLTMALNGQEGIDKAIETIPDIIISDVMMPEKDGIELLRTLKNDERTSHIPIVMLTAKADIQSKIEGLEQGADAYLAKPFYKAEILVRLKKLIELRKVLQLRYQNLTPDSTTINKTIMKEDAFLLKVRRSVESHISDENFGIAELCDDLAISRTQLHRKLTAMTGKSTSYVVRSIRLKKAKTLLQSTDLNVSEVGYEVGYANSSHFAQDFRKEFGQAPSQFKKK